MSCQSESPRAYLNINTFRHFRSISSTDSTPFFMAVIIPSISFFRLRGASNMSLPAASACAHTSSCPAMPFISKASVTVNPLKCNSSTNVCIMTPSEMEAGLSPNVGACRCPTITPPTPASMAFLKGYNSTLSKRERSKFNSGSAL